MPVPGSNSRARAAALVVALASLLAAPPRAAAMPDAASPTAGKPTPAAGAAPPHAPGHATVPQRFSSVERWKKMFDDPARAAWQKPEDLVKALALAPGDTVADLGAGTGYFSAYLSRAVGERGTVLAVEVEPQLVAHLRARAEKERSANLVPVLASFANPRLPAGSVDLLLIVDTFHHLDDRPHYFEHVRRALRGRARVAIVDFHKRPLPVGPGLDHKIAREDVIAEMTGMGFALDQDLDELLPYQYVLVFRPAAPAMPAIMP